MDRRKREPGARSCKDPGQLPLQGCSITYHDGVKRHECAHFGKHQSWDATQIPEIDKDLCVTAIGTWDPAHLLLSAEHLGLAVLVQAVLLVPAPQQHACMQRLVSSPQPSRASLHAHDTTATIVPGAAASGGCQSSQVLAVDTKSVNERADPMRHANDGAQITTPEASQHAASGGCV